MPCPFAALSNIFPELMKSFGSHPPIGSAEPLLKVLAPTGLDWRSSLDQLQARFGMTRYLDREEVIPLAPLTGLTPEPLRFFVRSTAHDRDLPPTYAFADYVPHDNAEQNHNEVVGALRKLFGPGLVGGSVNALSEAWEIGKLQLKVTTWPPELQSGPRVNLVTESSPRLRFRALVSIESRLAFIFPDERLAELLQRNDTEFLDNLPLPAEHSSLGRTVRYSRVTPEAMRSLVATTPLKVWRNRGSKRCGVVAPETTLDIPRADAIELQLHRILPARGSGGCELHLTFAPAGANPASNSSVALVKVARDTTALDPVAAEIARFWEIPVNEVESLDE